MSTNRYREQIDACRPGTGDLSLPALADLACDAETDKVVADEIARSERFDRAVSTAMHDVPLPAGLLERLESRLATEDVTDILTGEVALLPPAATNLSRRRILAAALSLAALVLIAVGAMFWPRLGREISNEQLVEMVGRWQQGVATDKWKSVTADTAPPAGFPVPIEVRRQPTAWQSFVTPDGQRGVVFNLTTDLRPARLYVIASRDKYSLPTIPYGRLSGASGGLAVGAWYSGGLLYVVVVDEAGQSLSDYIREKKTAGILRPHTARPA
jgi:hypothetical protein